MADWEHMGAPGKILESVNRNGCGCLIVLLALLMGWTGLVVLIVKWLIT